MTYNQIVLLVYVGYLLLFSLITFILFVVDKQLAIKEKTRIKEKVLLFFVAIGGGIGGYFGRVLGHNKTKKIYFSLIINLTLILQLLILGAMITTILIGSK